MTPIRSQLRAAIANPTKIPSALRARLEAYTAPDYLADVYRGDGSPDGHALLTLPMNVVRADEERYRERPNMWLEGEEIINVFNRLGYAVDVYDLHDSSTAPDVFDKYDVLFGGGRNFRSFAERVPDRTVRIFFASGMHWKRRKREYKRRLDTLEKRKGVRLDPQRPSLLEPHSLAEISDAVLARANTAAENSWAAALSEKPLRTVHVSHPSSDDCELETRNFETSRRKFMWFGGNGLVLKGLDVVLDAFSGLDGAELYVCGPVEDHEAFVSLYREELYETPNIHTLGWVTLHSEQYRELCRSCAYHLYPSASEGQSTAVATTMWYGVIPVVTEAVAAPGDWGVQLDDGTVETVAGAVERLADTEPAAVHRTARRAYQRARRVHDRENVSAEAERALGELLAACRTDV